MKFIPNAVSQKVGALVLKTQTHSPTILFGAGVVGVVATAVLASRATLKLEDVLIDHQKDSQAIENRIVSSAYTEQDKLKDQVLVYTKTVTEIGKLYAPSVGVGVASIGALAGSHHILNKRNAALAAAYTTLDRAFKAYRERVREDLGEDADRRFLYAQKVERVETNPETGKKVQKFVSTDVTAYGRLYDDMNVNFQHNYPEHNFFFLRAQQNFANELLRSRGWLTLNEVYKALGFEPTDAGMVVGWLLDGEGDGYVDFGIFDGDVSVYDFIRGADGAIFLNFNVDGLIHGKIG